MAKKYLLYIHDDDLFDHVDNKSELVNDLLNAHWNQNIPGSASSRKSIMATANITPETQTKIVKAKMRLEKKEEPITYTKASWGA